MTRYSHTKKSLAFLSFLCLFFFLCPNLAVAKEIGIRISPNLIEMHPLADGVVTREIIVENTGTDAFDLDILIKPFIGQDGQKLYYPAENEISADTKDFITNYVQVLDNGQPTSFLALGPKQKKKLSLQVTINSLQNISDYTFSVLFISRSDIDSVSSQEVSPLETRLNLRVGTGVHVLLAGQKETGQGQLVIQRFEAEEFLEHGPVVFSLLVKNNTSKYKKVYGNIIISNLFGQQVGNLQIPEQLILSGTTRALKGLIAQDPEASGELVWDEAILVGKYSARLELQALDESEYAEKTLSFSAIPLKPVLYGLFALIILIFVARSIKKHL